MIAVITSVLAGATTGLLAAVVSDHSLAASLATGCPFALGTLAAPAVLGSEPGEAHARPHGQR